MDPRVTRLAQRDQIVTIVCATFTQRFLMMNFLCFHDDPMLKTQLTEWMLGCVLISDPLPCSAISLLCSGITPILFIITIDLLLMLRAVPSIT